MQPLDPKKLITGFLLLATAISSLAVAFSTAERAPQLAAESPRASVPANAFVEPIVNADAPRAEKEPASLATTPTALTEELAKALAKELIAANADEPPGAASAAIPDIALTVDRIANTSTVRRIADDLAALQAPLHKPLVTDRFSREDGERYLGAVHEALASALIDPAIRKRLEAEATPEALGAVGENFRAAEYKLERLIAPRPLAKFHGAVLDMIARARSALTASEGSDDLLRDAVLAEARFRAADAAAARFEYEARALEGGALSFLNDARAERGHLAALLGISRAEAAGWPVFDIVTAALFSKETLNWAKKLALEMLKDRLIHQIMQQTVKWIQGGGKPQFITDWKGFLGRAADEAAGNALYRISPKLCQSFGPLIYVSLLPVDPLAGVDSPVSCTLSQVVENVREFAERFESGGWIAYGTALEPRNNFFGSLIETHDIALQESAAAAEAAENDATAAEGWLSTTICAKWSNELVGPPDPNNPTEQSRHCEKWMTTTPGAALGQTVYNALGAPIQRIVNAGDFAALGSALVNAAITKLIELGNSGINKGLAGVEVPNQEASASDAFRACDGLSDIPKATAGDYEEALALCNAIADPVAKARCLNEMNSGPSGPPPTERGQCIREVCASLPAPKPAECSAIPPTPSSTPSSTPSQCGPNPRQGCTCVGDPGGPTAGSFQFTGDVSGAQAAVLADCRAGLAVGLDCTGDPPSVTDRTIYTAAVAAKISPAAGIIAKGMADEVGVADEGRARSESFDIVTDPPSGASRVSSRPVGVCIPADDAIFP